MRAFLAGGEWIISARTRRRRGLSGS
jgi:hypothetical protein